MSPPGKSSGHLKILLQMAPNSKPLSIDTVFFRKLDKHVNIYERSIFEDSITGSECVAAVSGGRFDAVFSPFFPVRFYRRLLEKMGLYLLSKQVYPRKFF